MDSSKLSKDWDALYRDRPQRWFPSEAVLRFCARRLGEGQQHVLDVGCGNGANLWGLALHGYTVVGVDPSPHALTLAERLCALRCPKENGVLAHGTAQELMSINAVRHHAPYDAIIDHMVSQHLPWSEHEAVYATYLQLLKPGGWLCLVHLTSATVPDAAQTEGRVAEDYATWANIEAPAVYPNNGVVCMPTHVALLQLLMNGFRVQRGEKLWRQYWSNTGDMFVAAHSAFDAQKPEEA